MEYNVPPEQLRPNPPKKTGLVVAIIAVAVILLSIAGYFVWKNKKPVNTSNPPQNNISDKLPEGYRAVPVAEGEFPDGFPQSLVLSNAIKPFRAEDTVDDTGINQKIIEYYASGTPPSVLAEYKAEFPKRGWQVTGEGAGFLRFISSKTDSDGAQVIVTLYNDNDSQVKVIYLTSGIKK